MFLILLSAPSCWASSKKGQGVHFSTQRTVGDFFCMLRKPKIKYTMYSIMKKILFLCLAHKNFLHSGRGSGIISTRRDMYYFVNKNDKSNC